METTQDHYGILIRSYLLKPRIISTRRHPPLKRRLIRLQRMCRAAAPLSSHFRLDLDVADHPPRGLILLVARARLAGPARAAVARHRLRAHIGTSHGRASTGAKQASMESHETNGAACKTCVACVRAQACWACGVPKAGRSDDFESPHERHFSSGK